jgi:CRISPR/Cas system CSM-associated protein Csm3 (group 7 of RAMP superfamily)
MQRKKLTYSITFYSDWHIGSGLAAGAESNNVVLKNEEGFPIIPGKTLKGLLRDAAVHLSSFNEELVSKPFIKQVFGEGEDQLNEAEERAGVSVSAAQDFFTDAEPSEYLQQAFSKDQATALYRKVTSTAIGENGIALDKSLRTKEVTVPLTLYGQILDFPGDFENEMVHTMKWVKRLGFNRYRGLGKCTFQILNTPEND